MESIFCNLKVQKKERADVFWGPGFYVPVQRKLLCDYIGIAGGHARRAGTEPGGPAQRGRQGPGPAVCQEPGQVLLSQRDRPPRLGRHRLLHYLSTKKAGNGSPFPAVLFLVGDRRRGPAGMFRGRWRHRGARHTGALRGRSVVVGSAHPQVLSRGQDRGCAGARGPYNIKRR